MVSDKRKRLTDLGSEALADALMDLAAGSPAADEIINRLIATPQERIRRLRTRLADLWRMKHTVGRDESPALARELKSLLNDLKTAVDNPREGIELVASFYEADDALLRHCDDSDGNIRDLFRYDARNLFVHYASRCDDKNWLSDTVLKLVREDAQGLRDALITCAADYLPEEALRGLAVRLWELAGEGTERRHRLLSGIESLARQLRDAPLFERARRESDPALSFASCTEISRAYLEAGDLATALSWLERVPPDETSMDDERDHLLMAIHEKTGNREKLAEAAWRIFFRRRSEDTLSALLTVIGPDKKEGVVDDEVRIILEQERLSYTDASFLISSGRMDDAESYILARAAQLNGELYTILLPLAEAFEKSGHLLAASVIYRSLLSSLLSRAISKHYSYAVGYLKKLDTLSGEITDWKDIPPHAAYLAELKQAHARKQAFWTKYERELTLPGNQS